MSISVGDCFIRPEANMFMKVIEIIDEDYCICYMREYTDIHVWGNWKQSIPNILSAESQGNIRRLTPAEIVLYSPVDE